MGLFQTIFKTKNSIPTSAGSDLEVFTAYKPAFTSFSGSLYESEQVRSAIDARSRHIGKLKVEILGSAQGTLQTMLRHSPNQFQTWYQFLYRLNTILDMQNTAFIIPVFNQYYEVTGVYSILPSRCEIVKSDAGDLWIRYKFSNGDTGACKLSEIGIMTKFQYTNDLFGETNSALYETMNLIHLQNEGIEEAINNSASYSFMAQVNNFSKVDDLKMERKKFSSENLSRDSNSGGLLLFPNTYSNIKQLESKPFTISADERKIINNNVFNYYGVNEKILQNAAYGDDWSAFYEGAIEVFAIQFSEVITKMIYTNRQQSEGNQIMATSNRLQYMSNKDKLSVSSQMADRGIMSINEIREIWNLAPVEGGDVRIMRGEYKNSLEEENGSEDD